MEGGRTIGPKTRERIQSVDPSPTGRRLKLAETDPLSAANVNINNSKPTKKPVVTEGRRKIRSHRGSLRNKGAVAGGIGATIPKVDGMNHNLSNINRIIHNDAELSTRVTPLSVDPIPMDAESRWRDHHLKRQWAQSLIMESMEPVLSRHLRHAIKSVLHFTSVGPETMDIKALSHGMGHWDSLMTPIVLPPKTSIPESDGAKLHTSISVAANDVHKAHVLSISSSTEPTNTSGISAVPSTSQRQESSPLTVETSGDKLSRSTSLRVNVSPPSATPKDTEGSLSPKQAPIVVRGFASSTSSAHAPSPKADEHPSTAAKEESTEQHYKRDAPQPKSMDQQDIIRIPRKPEASAHRFESPFAAQEAEIVESLNSEDRRNHQPLQPQSRTSRLWTRVRRAVQGDFKDIEPSKNTVYLTAGSVAALPRSMSDPHLPSGRYASTSSSTTTNAVMPSFGSSIQSLLNEDQMSPQRGPVIITSGLRSSMAFDTPPETATNSPRPSSPISPTSPGSPKSPSRRSSSYQHNLPGLARRSSTKGSAAAAELTTAESRVSQFLYSDQQHVRHSSSTEKRTSIAEDLGLQQDFFSTPNALERSHLKSVLQKAPMLEDTVEGSAPYTATTTTAAKVVGKPFGRLRSTSDAPRRRPQPLHLQGSEMGRELHDVDRTILGTTKETHLRVQEYEMTSPDKESFARTRPSLDQQQEHAPSTPTTARNEGSGRSMSPYLSPESGSRLLSPPTQHLPTTKEERRKSAISFGGYLSSPVEAARRSRNMTMMVDQSDVRLDTTTDSKANGEVIHMRRTSFFERGSPPSLTTLTSLLQSSLPSLSQSIVGAASPSLSRSPSNATVTALEQYQQQHSRRASGISILASMPEVGDTSRHPVTTTIASNVSGASEARDAKKKVAPLKITPLLISGLSSMPSPMFAPLSASIPRGPFSSSYPSLNAPSASGPTLDRYFFTVDQVHEWNIPSYGRVRFTDHAPMVFQAIREQFNYTLADMDEALSQPMTVMKTPGKSDAIFFASHNHGRFLLKTLRGAEPENLKGFLSDYLAHIQKYPNTLLPRYLGMYTFERLAGPKISTGQTSTMDGFMGVGHGGVGGVGGGIGDRDHGSSTKNDEKTARRLHLNGTLLSGRDDGLPSNSKLVVVVLANVFDTPEIVHERYDFKGSNVGRRTLPVERTAREKASVPDRLLQPEIGRPSTELDQGPADIFGRRARRNDTPGAWRDSRASNSLYEPALKQEGASRNPGGAEDTLMADDISHLTLKEMDFQNRIFSGETQLIHLGPSRRLEVLSQLEDDTALLRKHGFMDYSMLVGIRIIPKVTPKEEIMPSSPEPSRRGSMSSRGSDADDSNLDSSSGSDDDDDDDEEDTRKMGKSRSIIQGEGELAIRLDRLWKAFLKDLSEKAQDALREVSSLGEGVMTLSGIHRRSFSSSSGHGGASGRIEPLAEDDGEDKLPAVELKPVHPSFRPSPTSKKSKKKSKGRDEDKDKGEEKRKRKANAKDKRKHESKPSMDPNEFDPDTFQTVRHAPRSLEANSHGPRRPTLAEVVGATAASGSGHQTQYQQQANTPAAIHPSIQQQQPMWSKGLASEGLPDGYEVVYYFGLIDILQKYNLVKWLEKNIKGANVRWGGGGGATGVAQNSVPLVHPGRSTPSSSFPGSSLYQLQASASEPSLPSVFQSTPPTQSSPTLSVLLEDSRSSVIGSSHDNDSTDRPPVSTPMTSGGLARTTHRTAHLDPSSSSTFSSARLSQEESSLNPPSSEEASSGSLHSSSTSSSSSSNPYPHGLGKLHPQSRLSTSVPFPKSVARLSQYSHSSQQSQHSHQSGRSRDSRLSFEIRESESMSSSLSTQPASGSPFTGNGFLSASPPSMGVLLPPQQEAAQQQQQQQQKTNPMHHYQMPQHAEVSVEEPGRYAERLIEFMRGAIV
ncbi:Phosphatidylinositol 5-phosphate 4-kinase type-2 alpha [Mortierella sp. NVP85]|nr:Phosphatidylinositol 5-phosphate 4-kinase type-2 alpha [Mortierella sp. NVP85]